MSAPPATMTFVMRLVPSAASPRDADAATGAVARALTQRELRELCRLLDLDAHDSVTVQLVDDALHLTVPTALVQAAP
jgi:hypothetical protein